MNKCTKNETIKHKSCIIDTTFYIQLAIVNNLTQVSLRQYLKLDWLKKDSN